MVVTKYAEGHSSLPYLGNEIVDGMYLLEAQYNGQGSNWVS